MILLRDTVRPYRGEISISVIGPFVQETVDNTVLASELIEINCPSEFPIT